VRPGRPIRVQIAFCSALRGSFTQYAISVGLLPFITLFSFTKPPPSCRTLRSGADFSAGGNAGSVFAIGRALAQEVRRQTPTRVTIVALGASNTEGWRVFASEAYRAKLQAVLNARGIDATAMNAGIPSDATGGMLARLDALCQRVRTSSSCKPAPRSLRLLHGYFVRISAQASAT